MTEKRWRCAIHAVAAAAAWIALFDELALATETAPADAGPAPAEQVAAEAKVPEGFRTTLFAGEPDVQQPIGIATDERGRLWVAENYTYADQATNFDETKRDRLVILEDADGDGRSDRRTVFWDQARKLTSVEIGYGGVWVLCAPNLLFIPDRDRDDVPDGPPEVVLDGFDENAIRHNIVNGLRWGPDGWLYGRHGILATSMVGKPGDDAATRKPINCGVWRYHPTRRVFETVAHGTTNPWGFDFDQHGEMFFINTVIGHLWHLVPGAHYERMYGVDFNPHLYELIGQSADHVHWDTGEKWSDIRLGVSDTTSALGGGHAHAGLLIYQGDNWPDRYRNSMFTLNFHGRRLNNDLLERRGSGYIGTHGDDLFFVQDEWFRGIDLISGADGAVYIADWSDTGECHEADGVHLASGRIFRLAYGSPAAPQGLNLHESTDAELVALQQEKNDWYVRQSRRLLAERAAVGNDMREAGEALRKMYEQQEDPVLKLRAMWGLAAIGAVDDAWLHEQLTQPDEHLRVWAIRLLVDRETVAAATIDRFVTLAATEPSPLVRLYLASALQRMPVAARWPLVRALALRVEDAADRQLPKMIWYGLEPCVPADSAQAIALCEQPIIPLLRRHIARRVASDYDGNGAPLAKLVASVGQSGDAALQKEVLQGIAAAFNGRRRVAAPSSWSEAALGFVKSDSPEVRQLAQELGVLFGDEQAMAELRTLAGKADADAESRRRAIKTLAEAGGPETLALLQRLVNDSVVANDAIRALAGYDDAQTPVLIVAAYPSLDAQGRVLAIDALASRPAYARALLQAVEGATVAREDVTAAQARQIANLNDAELTAELERLWGAVRAAPEEKRIEIERLRGVLEGGKIAAGDAGRGRVLFEKTCSACHVLYGEGKAVGPDLTGSDRHNLTYLLENVIDPSGSVGKQFQLTAVLLSSGRAVSGVVVGQTDRTLTLRTQTEEITVDLDEVDEMVEQPLSLMPDGLLTQLTDDQIGDLFRYLQSTAQVPLPAQGN